MIPDPGTILAAHAVDLRWSRWLAETEEDEHDQIGEEVDRCTCICGEEMDEEDFPAHQLAMLADAGIAVLALPEPDMSDEKFGQVWSNDPVVGTVQACLDGTCELRGDYEYTHQPAELREAAAVLLAAARAAGEAL